MNNNFPQFPVKKDHRIGLQTQQFRCRTSRYFKHEKLKQLDLYFFT